MKHTSLNTGHTSKVLALIISLGALPMFVGMTGCATGSGYERSTGESIEERATSSRVLAELGSDTQYKYGDVRVETNNGTVKLRGHVNSRDQKNRAEELAGRAVGVVEVINNITVKESAN